MNTVRLAPKLVNIGVIAFQWKTPDTIAEKRYSTAYVLPYQGIRLFTPRQLPIKGKSTEKREIMDHSVKVLLKRIELLALLDRENKAALVYTRRKAPSGDLITQGALTE